MGGFKFAVEVLQNSQIVERVGFVAAAADLAVERQGLLIEGKGFVGAVFARQNAQVAQAAGGASNVLELAVML